MYRLIFNVVDAGIQVPEAIERLYGHGPIHYSWADEPSDEEVDQVCERFSPDAFTRTPNGGLEGIRRTFGPDRADLVFSIYAHEVLDPLGAIVDSTPLIASGGCFTIGVYWFQSLREYVVERPLFLGAGRDGAVYAERRIFPLLGDGSYRYLPYASGPLVPSYVAELPVQGQAGNVLNFQLAFNPPEGRPYRTEEWTKGGLLDG